MDGVRDMTRSCGFAVEVILAVVLVGISGVLTSGPYAKGPEEQVESGLGQAGQAGPPGEQTQDDAAPSPEGSGPSLPADYVVGPEDVLGVLVWREPDMSGDVTVRSDGMITLPLVGDLQAAGHSPEALAGQIETLSAEYLAEPNVTVIVRQILSRKAFITGEVNAPGVYPLSGPLTVVQLIALAGGLTEFADEQKIGIMRTDDTGQTTAIRFNYKWIREGRNLEQNILLKPGDTVVVP